MTAYVVDARPEHILIVAEKMRHADVAEIWAAGRNTPRSALRSSLAMSSYCKTIMLGEKPIAMFGVTPLSAITGHGVPWMLGTHEIESMPMRFLRGSVSYLKDMARGFSYLENWVDARNKVSINWLRWLGFVIVKPEPYGHLGYPFHRFYMENKSCAD